MAYSVLLAILLTFGACSARAVPVARPTTDTDRLVRDLCGRDIVMLGEANMHGGGATNVVRAGIARRLIEECGFNTVFIETGIYDLLHQRALRAAGATTSKAELASAIGLMQQASATESEPWLTYLAAAASSKTRRIEVFGLQDSVHSTAEFAQHALPAVLASHVPATSGCQRVLERYTRWLYTDEDPDSAEERRRLTSCLTEVASVAAGDDAAMATSLGRQILSSTETDDLANSNANDHALYLNLAWQLAAHGPPHAKALVLCATVHAARQVPDGVGRIPFGAYVHDAYGDRAAVVAFSAFTGTYAMISHPEQTLDPAAPDSIEGVAFAAGSETAPRYFDHARLRDLGTMTARPLTYRPVRASWATLVDGIVVIRDEHAPHFAPRSP